MDTNGKIFNGVELFSIKDEKASLFNQPFASVNQTEATRNFQTACQDNTIQLGLYPDDFSLYSIGMFNKDNGEIVKTSPKFIVSGTSFKKTTGE